MLDQGGLSARMIADQLGHSRISMAQDVYMGRRVVDGSVASALEGLFDPERPWLGTMMQAECQPRIGRSRKLFVTIVLLGCAALSAVPSAAHAQAPALTDSRFLGFRLC